MPLPLPPQVPGLPVLGNALDFRRNPIELLQRGYETIGPIFSIRLGPKPAVVIIGPENTKFFFDETDKRLSMSKVYQAFVPIFGDGFMLAAEPGEYREQRAILQPALSGAKMADNVRTMVRETEAWMTSLGREGEFELTDSFERLSLDIVACSLMGDEYRDRMGSDYFSLYRDVVRGIDFVLPRNLPIPKFRRRDRARKTLHERIGQLIAERRSNPGGHTDFVQSLAEATYSDGREIPIDRLESMILFLVFSASESTPLQASWSLIQLLQHPSYLATVLDEQMVVLGGCPDTINLDTLRQLNRLQWALTETERLRPMTTMLWRETLEPYDLGSYHVPQGWITIISPAISQRLSDVFPDPDSYDPERYSPSRAEDRKNIYALADFGGGTHRCPGHAFAHNLMKVVFSMLLQRYTLSLVNPDPKPDFSSTITRPESPCLIRYRPRDHSTIVSSAPAA